MSKHTQKCTLSGRNKLIFIVVSLLDWLLDTEFSAYLEQHEVIAHNMIEIVRMSKMFLNLSDLPPLFFLFGDGVRSQDRLAHSAKEKLSVVMTLPLHEKVRSVFFST